MLNGMKNKDLLDAIDSKVLWHSKAKKILINSINKQQIRIRQMCLGEERIDLDVVLLVGESGTGKTFLVRELTNLCDCAVISLDATNLAPGESAGRTDSKAVEKLIRDCKSSHVIVFIDEVDKLAREYESSGNWNKQVQSHLLTMLNGDKEPFDRVLWILAGSFSDLREAKAIDEKSFGFTTQREQKENCIDDRDLIKYGLMPEFVGRMSHICELDYLGEKEFRQVLDNLILPDKVKDLQYFGYHDFTLSEEQKIKLCSDTIDSKQGVRYLKRRVSEMTIDLEFNYENREPERILTTPMLTNTKGGANG